MNWTREDFDFILKELEAGAVCFSTIGNLALDLAKGNRVGEAILAKMAEYPGDALECGPFREVFETVEKCVAVYRGLDALAGEKNSLERARRGAVELARQAFSNVETMREVEGWAFRCRLIDEKVGAEEARFEAYQAQGKAKKAEEARRIAEKTAAEGVRIFHALAGKLDVLGVKVDEVKKETAETKIHAVKAMEDLRLANGRKEEAFFHAYGEILSRVEEQCGEEARELVAMKLKKMNLADIAEAMGWGRSHSRVSKALQKIADAVPALKSVHGWRLERAKGGGRKPGTGGKKQAAASAGTRMEQAVPPP